MAVINPDSINLEWARKHLISVILLSVFTSASTNISRHLAPCKYFANVNEPGRFLDLSPLMNMSTEARKQGCLLNVTGSATSPETLFVVGTWWVHTWRTHHIQTFLRKHYNPINPPWNAPIPTSQVVVCFFFYQIERIVTNLCQTYRTDVQYLWAFHDLWLLLAFGFFFLTVTSSPVPRIIKLAPWCGVLYSILNRFDENPTEAKEETSIDSNEFEMKAMKTVVCCNFRLISMHLHPLLNCTLFIHAGTLTAELRV